MIYKEELKGFRDDIIKDYKKGLSLGEGYSVFCFGQCLHRINVGDVTLPEASVLFEMCMNIAVEVHNERS